MKHIKKIGRKYFEAIIDGSKPFEVREEDDCKYEVGDLIELLEIEEHEKILGLQKSGKHKTITKIHSTGRTQAVEVTYRLSHEDFPQGIKPNYVVLGIKLRSDEE